MPTHAPDDAHTTYFWGAKGGVGTSTVAALHALTLARAGYTTTLAAADGDHGELAALLGLAAVERADGDRPFDVNALIGQKAGLRHCVVVVDGATDPAHELAVSRRLLVIRPCYLAVRRALQAGPHSSDGIVLVEETERSLARVDIEDVLGRPVLATVAVRPEIARTIDAGLLIRHTPRLALDRPHSGQGGG